MAAQVDGGVVTPAPMTTPTPVPEINSYTVGVIVAVVGNIAVSFSYQFQKLAHKNNVDKKPYTSLPLWWLGLALMLGGEVGNFLAYGWAPATVVSPLGAASVVANALLAHVLLKEYLTRRNCIGVGLAIVGSVVISVTAPVTIIEDAENEDVNYIYVSLVQWRALIFLIMVVVASVILANPFNMKQLVSEEFRSTHIWANCMMCGLLGCITVMGAKGVSTAFTELINNKLDMWTGPDCWLTYVLVVSAVGSIVGQVNFLNRAMMCFDASDVVPVYFVLFTLCTVTTGMVLYLEIKFEDWGQALGFVLSILATFGGVYLIQNGKKKKSADSEDEEAGGIGERSAQYRAKDDASPARYLQEQEEDRVVSLGAALEDDGMGIGLELQGGSGAQERAAQPRTRGARKEVLSGVSREDLRKGASDGVEDGASDKRPSSPSVPIGWGSPKAAAEGANDGSLRSVGKGVASGVLGAAGALATASTAAAAGTAAGMVELAAAAGLASSPNRSYAIYESEDEADEEQDEKLAKAGAAHLGKPSHDVDVEDLSDSEHLLTHTSAAPSSSAGTGVARAQAPTPREASPAI